MTGKYSNSKKSVTQLAKQMGLPVKDKINKNDAKFIISEAIVKGVLKFPSQGNEINYEQLLVPYVEKICDYDTSPWVKAETQRKGRSHSKRYLNKMLRGFQIHAKPLLPKDTQLRSFSKKEAIALQDKMFARGASPDAINSAMEALKTAFNYAEATGLIDFNPMIGVKKFFVERRERVPLTRLEAINVMNVLQKHSCETVARKSVFLAYKLAIFAGMRLSEIRAFSLSMLSPVSDDNGNNTDFVKIAIDKSWDDGLKVIGPTKGRYNRTTVITKKLADELIAFGNDTGRINDTLLFKATKDTNNKFSLKNVPMSKTTFETLLYEALYEIGIDEETRRERKLDFHSLRHFYDSEAKGAAARMSRYKEELRAAVGHKSVSVDELIYTHDTATSLIMVGIMSEHILDL